ncbi:CENP-b protein 1 [Gigaspora margarita]|uniref:CENP-b protein 1 n=1 Tax=Gigaspora margarita TaxID=4874 RepID=A0A8H3X2K8_GIGMA|nr:CENP-b protein 1 [Gigaspora margarita]
MNSIIMIESGGSLVDKSLVSESQALALKRSLNNNDTTETMKVKRVTLTKAQKAEICQLRKSGFTQLELANKFKIGESTVLKILKQQQNYWLSIDPNAKEAKSKRDRSAKHLQLEEILNLWISKAEAHHQTITAQLSNTEILPSNYFSLISWELEEYELIDLTLPRPQLEANPNPTDLVTEIQSLISQFPITNLMQANDFINVDNGVGTDIMLK